MHRLQATITEPLYQKLKEERIKTDLSTSELIRRSLEHYFASSRCKELVYRESPEGCKE